MQSMDTAGQKVAGEPGFQEGIYKKERYQLTLTLQFLLTTERGKAP